MVKMLAPAKSRKMIVLALAVSMTAVLKIFQVIFNKSDGKGGHRAQGGPFRPGDDPRIDTADRNTEEDNDILEFIQALAAGLP